MIPLYDENPSRTTPIVTWGIIAIAIAVFLYEFLLPTESALNSFIGQYALVPANLLSDPNPQNILTLFTAMFLHAGWFHLILNMLFLWIFGNNVEDTMGHIGFLIFYFVSGLGASALQIFVDPNSQVPNLGASGAIAGVLGAYILLYPRARVITLLLFGYFIRLVPVPAVFFLGLWFILQLFSGFLSLGVESMGGGVAFFAHIGGFVTGLLLVNLFARRRYP